MRQDVNLFLHGDLLRALPLANGATIALKWPNDVLAGGKKLVGIGLEAEAVGDCLAVVVGIGTNVVAAPEGTPTPATSLAALGVHISAEELFTALSEAWVEFRGIWDKGRGFAEIRRLWLERAAGLGEKVAIHTGSATLEGIFDTIDESGCLIVRTAEGRRVPVAAVQVLLPARPVAALTASVKLDFLRQLNPRRAHHV